MSSDDRYRSTRPGLFEFLTTVGIKYQVYPKLFGYPRLLEIARKFDHLSLQEKGEFIERLIRGYRMRRHFTPDSEVPLLTKGTRIRTENGGRVRFGRSVRLNGARIFVGSRGNSGDGILVIGDRTEIGQTKLNVIAPLTIGARLDVVRPARRLALVRARGWGWRERGRWRGLARAVEHVAERHVIDPPTDARCVRVGRQPPAHEHAD